MEKKDLFKKLAEEKLNAFTVGNMGNKTVSRQKLKDQRRRDDEAIGHVFQEFFTAFQEPNLNSAKIWIKGGVYNPELNKESPPNKDRIYKPNSRTTSNESSNTVDKVRECAKLLHEDMKQNIGRKKETEMKKSNLELLKEEMKQQQEEREERQRIKESMSNAIEAKSKSVLNSEPVKQDNCNLNTTNLFVTNLPPTLTEKDLMDIFGKYGPLASVKIMWPRTEEEKSRGHNCGFVAFMNRIDGERALKNLNGKKIMGFDLKLDWGKYVPIPSQPVYIPEFFVELSKPPPLSGLPFNAQPINNEDLKNIDKMDPTKINEIISHSVVKVVIPTNRQILFLIHRMIEFVIREGPLFEAIIMRKEINNPLFSFLFDNQSHYHTYYRWKLFSIMQGDSQKEWRTEDFRMFEGGSIWRPPPINIYSRGMPDNYIENNSKDPNKSLSVAQKERFQKMLKNIYPERMKIAEIMLFCMQHAQAADEICDYIVDAMKKSTNIHFSVSCLYLISDILNNCQLKIINSSYLRRAIDIRITDIFEAIFNVYKILPDKLDANSLKIRIIYTLEVWKKSLIYSKEIVSRLENMFKDTLRESEFAIKYGLEQNSEDENEDGIPLEETNFVYRPTDFPTSQIIRRKSKLNIQKSLLDDIDGVSLSPSPPKILKEDKDVLLIHIPSKWD